MEGCANNHTYMRSVNFLTRQLSPHGQGRSLQIELQLNLAILRRDLALAHHKHA
jgi:hypothetical protein